MSTHPDIEGYILGQHDEIEAVEAHIAGCDECLGEVGREARFELLLHTAGREDAFASIVPPARRRRWPYIAAAGLAVAVAAAFVSWPSRTAPERRMAPPAVRTSQQPSTRPAWAAGIEPETARCSESGGALTCAASAFGASRDEADAAASDIATEALLELAVLRGDEAIRNQRALYRAARSAALASPDRATTRRLRHAVVSGAPLGQRDSWYWEEYNKLEGGGIEFLVFVRFTAHRDDMTAFLIAHVARPSGTAELVPIVPGVRWALDLGDDLGWFVVTAGDLTRVGVRAGDVLVHDPRRRLIDLPGMIQRHQLRIWRDGRFR